MSALKHVGAFSRTHSVTARSRVLKETVAETLGLELEVAADGIVRVLEQHVRYAIEKLSLERYNVWDPGAIRGAFEAHNNRLFGHIQPGGR